MVFEEKVHLFVSTHRPVDFLAFGVNAHPFGLSFTVLLFGLAMNCWAIHHVPFFARSFTRHIVAEKSFCLLAEIALLYDLGAWYLYVLILLLTQECRKNLLPFIHFLLYFLHSKSQYSLRLLYFAIRILFLNDMLSWRVVFEGLFKFFCLGEVPQIIGCDLFLVLFDPVSPNFKHIFVLSKTIIQDSSLFHHLFGDKAFCDCSAQSFFLQLSCAFLLDYCI